MRFVVELAPAADGRVEGSLGYDGVDGVVRFSGWLELLRLLEVHMPPTPPSPTVGAEGSFEAQNVMTR